MYSVQCAVCTAQCAVYLYDRVPLLPGHSEADLYDLLQQPRPQPAQGGLTDCLQQGGLVTSAAKYSSTSLEKLHTRPNVAPTC